MLKYFFVTIIFFVIVGAGCTQENNTQTTDKQSKNTQTKIITWCNEAKSTDNELWISSEFFSGMNHAPTIRHVCRGNEELFHLEMVWDDSASPHTGTLVSKKSQTSLPISSENKDPEFELLPNQTEEKVLFSVDKKIFMYDITADKFTANP